ncbi:DNA damage-inducible protein D [Janthinobacterium kumbetense]|uniref:DNA damage-inducible protein D n=1 Tax=Janthinobacterium kumbetense TaxID=2950280 RepID=A0ABT0WQN5_9BURK|nr:DNA damage-inducible protein D [Janthinobacterium kumbetense]MCM2566287.1 DNA damage-inducible protein D [Janthinobacterium kumbetense]
MSKDEEGTTVPSQTAKAALENIRRMLKGEIEFPTPGDATAEMIKAAVPVVQSITEEPPFHGTSEEVIAGFENAAKMTAENVEYWSALELMGLFGYGAWKSFEGVIQRAYIACNQSGLTINEHFAEISEKVETQAGIESRIYDIHVTRYGAYLIAQNADSKKKQVAFAQTYFAVQTRRQELKNKYDEQLVEQQRRLSLRNDISVHNKDLADAAKDAGVIQPMEYAEFQNSGYRGLYNGLNAMGIKNAKRLTGNAKILDHMGSTELAANLFRLTQAEEKLRREGIRGKFNANAAHFEVGQKVRKAIADIGGTMPEKLEPAEDINKIRHRLRKEDPPKIA